MSVPVWGDNSSAPKALSQHPLVSKASAAVKNKYKYMRILSAVLTR